MLTLLALCAGLAAGRVIDSLDGVPRGWAFVRDASPSDPIRLHVALHQQGADALEQAVLEVSSPGHANYGMHLSRDEVRALTAPSRQTTTSVMNWITRSGIDPVVNNDFVTIDTTVTKANALLDTSFAWYQYEDGSEPRLRTLAYSFPDDLVTHIDMVQPTTRFGRFSAKKSTVFEVHYPEEGSASFVAAQTADAVSCSPVTPACLKSLYNINYTAPSTGNLLAIASYLEEYARYADLQTFESKFVPAAKGQNFTVQLANGGLDDQNSKASSVEANLDLQYVVGVAQPIPVLEYSTGGRGPLVPTKSQPTPPGSNEPYLEFLTYILAQDDADLPQTLSTSYGEEEQSIPRDYALKVCNMFMQLGARGVSVLFSSGDSGPGQYCIRNSDNATFFEASFPAACPYVTAVGGTVGVGPEKGVDFSGGGFSTYWQRPAWQEEAVATYLRDIGDTYSEYFNSSSRAIPDVAAQASNFAVIDKGRQISVGGTSASGPAFAGAIALLNAARKSQGQPPLGFLNPWLYNNSAAFTDITAGYSVGCSSVRGGAKWNATAGWDTVTGLGTPKFDALLEAAAPGVPNA